MASVNEDFARRLIALHGEAGRTWLGGLPALVEHCARRWELKVGPPFAPLSYNYAAPAYEVGALLRNPMPQLLRWPDPVRVTARRIAQLSDELGFERERVRGWGLAQAVLSAWWAIEDEGELGEHGYAAAEILAAAKI